MEEAMDAVVLRTVEEEVEDGNDQRRIAARWCHQFCPAERKNGSVYSFKLSQNHSRIKTPYFYGLWLCDLTSPVPHGGATVRRTHHVLE